MLVNNGSPAERPGGMASEAATTGCTDPIASLEHKIGRMASLEINLSRILEIVNEVSSATDIRQVLDGLARGYATLGASGIAFALFQDDQVHITGIHPKDLLDEVNRIMAMDIANYPVDHARFPENPFYRTAHSGMPLLFAGPDGLRRFFANCFPTRDTAKIDHAVSLMPRMSILMLPLRANQRYRGSVALAAADDVLDAGFDNYTLLSYYAADVISRQQHRDRASRSEATYRRLMGDVKDLIVLCDDEGIIRYANHNIDDAIAKNGPSIFGFFSGQNRTTFDHLFAEARRTAAAVGPLQIPVDGPAGTTYWSEISIKPFPGEEGGYEVVAHDITVRKRMESEVDNLSSFQKQIFHNRLVGIATMSFEGAIYSWNTGATSMLGYDAGEMQGLAFTDIMPRDEVLAFRSQASAVIRRRSQESFITRLRARGGHEVSVSCILSVMRDSGADAMIAMFFDISERVRLEEHSRELVTLLSQAQQMTILTLTKLTEYRDIETGSHLERIMKYTEVLASELATFSLYQSYITRHYIDDLVMSSPLHDIGKVGIPDSILRKPGRYTPEEFEIMKHHTTIGGNSIAEAERMVKGRSFLKLGKEVVFNHHERWDGSGYPRGLRGEDIPLSARIVALADVYDALTTKRPYKDAFTHRAARDIIVESSGKHFDASVVRAFLNREMEFNRWRDHYRDSVGEPSDPAFVID